MKNIVQTALKEYVREHGIKQRYISKVTGLPECMVSDIFCMRREMKADEFVDICAAIGKSPNDFAEQK